MSIASDYLVKDARLVFYHLTELVANKCLISAHFGDEDSSFLTAIVYLDKTANLLQLDCAPFDALNHRLLTATKVLFRAEIDGIQVSFVGKNIKKIKVGGAWVLSMPVPNSIFWFQRRNFFRVKIPLSHTGSICKLTFKIGDTQVTENFTLCDLSIRGLSFLNPNPEWRKYLHTPFTFSHSTLYLHNGNQADISFEIRNSTPIRISHSDTYDRIGCLLQNVAPRLEQCIQHYMNEIELKQKTIHGGDK